MLIWLSAICLKGGNPMSNSNICENTDLDINKDDPTLEREADFIEALCEYLAQGDTLALEWLEYFLI